VNLCKELPCWYCIGARKKSMFMGLVDLHGTCVLLVNLLHISLKQALHELLALQEISQLWYKIPILESLYSPFEKHYNCEVILAYMKQHWEVRS
jgi:hypothetical protein